MPTFIEITNSAAVMYGILLIAFLLTYIAFYKDSDKGTKSDKKHRS